MRAGDITRDELNEIWARVPKADSSDRIDADGFLRLRDEIEDLFEDPDEPLASQSPTAVPAALDPPAVVAPPLAAPQTESAPSGAMVARLMDAIASVGSTVGGVDASSNEMLAVALAAEAVVKDPNSPSLLRSADMTAMEVKHPLGTVPAKS